MSWLVHRQSAQLHVLQECGNDRSIQVQEIGHAMLRTKDEDPGAAREAQPTQLHISLQSQSRTTQSKLPSPAAVLQQLSSTAAASKLPCTACEQLPSTSAHIRAYSSAAAIFNSLRNRRAEYIATTSALLEIRLRRQRNNPSGQGVSRSGGKHNIEGKAKSRLRHF